MQSKMIARLAAGALLAGTVLPAWAAAPPPVPDPVSAVVDVFTGGGGSGAGAAIVGGLIAADAAVIFWFDFKPRFIDGTKPIKRPPCDEQQLFDMADRKTVKPCE